MANTTKGLILDVELSQYNYNFQTSGFTDNSGYGNTGVKLATFTTDKYNRTNRAINIISGSITFTDNTILDIGYWPLKSKYETKGDNIIINGTFDTDSDWDLGTGWSISDGKAVATNATENLTQLNSIVIGKRYSVSFNISDRTSGVCTVNLGTGTSLGTTSEDGHYSYDGICTGSTDFYFNADTDVNLKIDNVIIKEILTLDKTPYENNGSSINTFVDTGYTYFNGSSYIDLGTDLNTSYLSLSCWVKFDTLGNNEYIIIKCDDLGEIYDKFSYRLMKTAGNYISFNISDDGLWTSQEQILSTNPVLNDTWYNIVSTYDGNYIRLYIDSAVAKTPTSYVSTIYEGTGKVTIGARYRLSQTMYAFNFSGNLSDVRIYNRALSTTEITEIYNKGR